MTPVREEVVHTHVNEGSSGSSMLNFLLGLIALVVLLYILFMYGLPLLRNATSAPQINVPEQVDVNVNQK